MRTLAVLPVKRFEHAKQRLSEHLRPEHRAIVAQAMVEDVLRALIAAPDLDGVLVVTNEASVRALCERLGAVVEPDPHESGQSAATTAGIDYALAAGIERVLLVPGDCPGLDAGELAELLGHRSDDGPAVVIVPDRHGSGTNALLLSPPDVIAPAFGPGSFERHRDLALAAQASWTVARPETLLLDIDTPEDLATLLAGPRERAPRTRAVLLTVTGAR
jgi:2-phospho-L-lactate/phosphoenolpyruvate guanylyltransferase